MKREERQAQEWVPRPSPDKPFARENLKSAPLRMRGSSAPGLSCGVVGSRGPGGDGGVASEMNATRTADVEELADKLRERAYLLLRARQWKLVAFGGPAGVRTPRSFCRGGIPERENSTAATPPKSQRLSRKQYSLTSMAEAPSTCCGGSSLPASLVHISPLTRPSRRSRHRLASPLLRAPFIDTVASESHTSPHVGSELRGLAFSGRADPRATRSRPGECWRGAAQQPPLLLRFCALPPCSRALLHGAAGWLRSHAAVSLHRVVRAQVPRHPGCKTLQTACDNVSRECAAPRWLSQRTTGVEMAVPRESRRVAQRQSRRPALLACLRGSVSSHQST